MEDIKRQSLKRGLGVVWGRRNTEAWGSMKKQRSKKEPKRRENRKKR